MSSRFWQFTLAAAAAVAIAAALPPSAEARQGWGSGLDRIRCESQGGRERHCSASIEGDVRVVRQLSDTRCREGSNWRWDRSGIFVRDGCRAEFEFRRRDSGWGGGGGGGWGGGGGSWGGGGGSRDRVTCQSQNDRAAFCPAPIAGDVRVARQLSDTNCVFRRNWNWNNDGVRVWDGCRAEFEFRRRGGELTPGGTMRIVTCQSQRDREQFCPAPIAGDVRVVRNISDTRCREGRNWNWTRDGVRVWEGCRADFEYRPR